MVSQKDLNLLCLRVHEGGEFCQILVEGSGAVQKNQPILREREFFLLCWVVLESERVWQLFC